MGLSNTNFNGLPLPFNLGAIGITGCTLYHDIVASQSLTTNAAGQASFPMVWPVDVGAIGVPIYSSYLIIDIGVPRPLPMTISNALTTRVGGNM